MKIRIGTRGSRLALWQANHVRDLLVAAHPGLEVEVERIRTRGDRDQATSLTATGGIGFFTKEIEHALLAGEVDVAVHSLKDLPTVLAPGLSLGAVPEREDTRDALIGRPGRVASLAALAPGTRVATSSPRRRGQILAAFPGIRVEPIRGNVPTRIEKVREPGGPDATILALAGLRRLGLSEEIAEILPFEVMLPAAGQGALGIEIREEDRATREVLAPLDDGEVHLAVTAERAFLNRLEGGCTIPAGALALVTNGVLRIEGVVADPEGAGIWREELVGPAEHAETLGRTLADRVSAAGAGELLARLREEGE